VTPQGMVLDSAGIVISQAATGPYYPVLAFDGTNFLVVWQGYYSGSGDEIYGARVTPAGVVLDTAGIVIPHAANGQWNPALAFDGTNFLVVWQGFRSDSLGDIYGARVTPQGTVLDSAGIAISTAESYQLYPALAFDGTNFLVVWEDHRSGHWGINGARVTPAGMVLDTAGFVISQASDSLSSPALAFDGSDFLVVWQDCRSDSLGDIYGARVTPGGTVFDAGSVVSQQAEQSYPGLCCGNGSQMLLVYQGWADTVGGKVYNTDRIWGKMDPNLGVAEAPNADVRTAKPLPSIVRGFLLLPGAAGGDGPAASARLLDVSGRKVMGLHSGANDVRALAPGVYFVREEPQAATLKPQAVRKVVLAR